MVPERLVDLGRVTQGGLLELLGRVPVAPEGIEEQLQLPPGFVGWVTKGAWAATRQHPEAVKRFHDFLAAFCVESMLDEAVPLATLVNTGTPGADVHRLMVRCPRCHSDFMVGASGPLDLIATTHERRGHRVHIAFLWSPTGAVRCPAATHAHCTAAPMTWQPGAVTLVPDVSTLDHLDPLGSV